MKEETKNLCHWASQLYESDRMPASEIYACLLNTKTRIKEVAQAKQIVGYMLYNHCDYTLQQVANELNLTNHSTAIYWIDKIQTELRTNSRMKNRYNYMLDVINGNPKPLSRNKNTNSDKNVLSEYDMQYIKSNMKFKYNVSYYADMLRKNRSPINAYLRFLKKQNAIFGTQKSNTYKPKLETKKIDY
jgi:hypothetical protein